MSATPCLIVDIPGPVGPAGTAGTNGTNGVNAWTTVSLQFGMPLEGASTVVSVVEASWMAVGQKVFLGDPAGAAKGTFQVIAVTGNNVTLNNLKNTASGLYTENSPFGTIFPIGTVVSPSGLQGPAGATPAGAAPNTSTYILQTPDANLANAQALSALGTGLMKVTTATGVVISVAQGTGAGEVPSNTSGLTNGDTVFATATGLETKTAANARTALGLGTMSAQNANAVSVTGGSITGITDLAIADGGTAASTVNGAQDSLGKLLPRYGLLGSLTAADLNVATSDNAVTMRSTRYVLDKVTVEAASVNLTAATLGLFTAAGGGGTTLATDQALSALTASTKFLDLTLAAVTGTDVLTAGTLYARVGTPQGVAATANVWFWGYRLD